MRGRRGATWRALAGRMAPVPRAAPGDDRTEPKGVPTVHDHDQLAPRPIRVMAVDDHGLVLDLLARAFGAEPDLEVIGTAASLGEFAELAQQAQLQPDVVVMDRH